MGTSLLAGGCGSDGTSAPFALEPPSRPAPATPAPVPPTAAEDPGDTDGLDSIHPFLAVPADGHLVEMPVVIITFLPTRDGETVDRDIIGPGLRDTVGNGLDAMEAHIQATALNTKYMLEEGSRFRGYRDPAALPMLGYRVIEEFTFYEAIPRGRNVPWAPGVSFPDWEAILERVGGRDLVNREGVREFWIYQYHHGDIAPLESNMASPTTSDVSNSDRVEDLPVYDSTYVVYAYNYTRTENENVHNHGHQLEVILSHANERQAGNSDFFWKDFVGRQSQHPDVFTTGRAGWTHMPPNTTEHYDYRNPAVVESDIEDWTPAGTGTRRRVSAETWRTLPYLTPVPDPAARLGIHGGDAAETHWYIYWMQNMPGRDNRIRREGGYLSNWWWFTGDWDASIRSGLGLWNELPSQECVYELEPTRLSFGAEGGEGVVTLFASPSCAWEAWATDGWVQAPEPDSGGDGSRTIAFRVARNPGLRRAGAIVAGGRLLVVVQEAATDLLPGRGCSYELSRSEVSFGADGGVRRIEVLASRPECRWEAYSADPWVRAGAGPIWRGNADLAFSVAPLPDGHDGPRLGTLVLAGKEVHVAQRRDE